MDGRFDLGRFKRAVRSRVRGDFEMPVRLVGGRLEFPEGGWRIVGDVAVRNPFAQSFDQSEQLARRKLILEAERYGEEMHEGRE